MLFFCFPPIKLTDMTVLIFLLLFIGSFLNLLWIHHSFIHSFIQINDLCVISLIPSLYNSFVLSSLVLSLFTQYSFIHYLTTHSLTHSLTHMSRTVNKITSFYWFHFSHSCLLTRAIPHWHPPFCQSVSWSVGHSVGRNTIMPDLIRGFCSMKCLGIFFTPA